MFAIIVLAIANATEAEQELLNATWFLSNWTMWLTVATFISGGAVAGVAFIIWRNQRRFENRLSSEQRMLDLRRDFDANRDFMNNLRNWHKDLKAKGMRAVFDPDICTEQLRIQADKVEDSFETAGRLVLRDLVNFDDYLAAYSKLTLDVWHWCSEDIEDKRKTEPLTGKNFEALKKRIEKTPKHHHREIVESIAVSDSVSSDKNHS
jgi:hypothetical protein